LAVAAGQPRALGQTLSWNNAAGGSASTATNWNPNQIPVATSDMVFNLANIYTVSYNATAPSSHSHTFKRGTVTLSVASPHTTEAGGFVVGDVAGDNAIASLTTGVFTSLGNVFIGDAVGSTGVLNVTGNNADFIAGTGGTDVNVGNGGNGTLNITGSGLVQVADLFLAGNSSGSVATVLVSGFSIAPISRSTLDVNGTGTSRIGAGGDVAMTIDNGALATFAGSLTIANGSASTSSITVQNQGLLDSTLSVAGDLNIARNASAGAAAGTGTLTVNADGAVSVGGTIHLGDDPDGGTGVLRVNQGGTLSSHGLTAGAGGDIQHAGGSITVTGGPFTHDETTLVVSGASPGPTLILDALTNVPTFAAATESTEAIIVANSGTGVLTLTSGANVAATQGKVTIGNGTGSSGTLNVESGAMLTASGATDVVVGDEGAGTLNARSGAQVTADGIFVSQGIGTGTLLAENPGTHLTASAVNFFSGATVMIRDGAVLTTSANVGHQVPVQAGASLTLDNATIDATTDVAVDGTLNMTNGTIHADHFDFSIPISASGVIDAKIVGTQPITATGDLSLGDDSIGAINGTPINVGAFRVETLDADDSILGNTTINGGILLASDNFLLPTGRTISGTGTIAGNLTNSGAITATGASGLSIGGLISGIGQGIGGTRYNFLNGGGFTGSGAINSRIAGQAGSRIVITGGTASLGDGSTFAFSTDGELDIARDVTINDSNGIGLGSLTTLRGAALTCTSDVSLGSLPAIDTLAGGGSIIANLSNAGIVSPGFPGLDPTSQISISGTYSQISGTIRGTLNIEIEGTGAGDFDRIIATSVVLDGTLNVTLINSFLPTPGFSRPVIGGATRTGQFLTTHLPTGFHVRYTNTSAEVVYCPADFNDSGTVTVQDIFEFLAAYFGNDPRADFNASGAISVQDIFDFLAAYFAGCP
jgi:T5SS/PEP-CTERM-associated repeat protein